MCFLFALQVQSSDTSSSLSHNIIYHHQCHHIEWTHAGTQYRKADQHKRTCAHKHVYTEYIYTHTHMCSPVYCDLPAPPTKLWLTGCYRSHLRPFPVCTILDICVYIKEGIDGKGDGGSGVSTISVYQVPAAWMRTARGNGRHLIKTVAAHLRQLDFSLGLVWDKGNGAGGCGHEWRSVDVCFGECICTIPQMGWAYVCEFLCV